MDFGEPHGRAPPPSAVPAQRLRNTFPPVTPLSPEPEGHDFSRAAAQQSLGTPALAAEGSPAKRMLAVLQFSEDDDMAFTLDRMFTRINPMRARLSSGRCFLRFVVIEDQDQRRSICSALNQWMVSSAEKASGIAADFQSSLELSRSAHRSCGSDTPVRLCRQHSNSSPGCTAAPETRCRTTLPRISIPEPTKNLHCPHPLPSGF